MNDGFYMLILCQVTDRMGCDSWINGMLGNNSIIHDIYIYTLYSLNKALVDVLECMGSIMIYPYVAG